jgi:tubulin polyglutamylase TTLL6/13
MGHNVDELKARIDDMLIKTMITGYPTLSKIQQTVHPENYANDMCFEVLGFDVMLDHNLNPIILEVYSF